MMVSVIIPTFNAESSIERAVRSVLNQSYQDFEIIIYDDHSTDSTWELLNKLAKQDARIRVFQNKQNAKSAFTRNQAIKEATGVYIMQLDDDDYCHGERMEKQVDFLNRHEEYGFVGCHAYLWDQTGVYGERRVKEKPKIADMIKTSPFINPSVMFRRQVLDSVSGYRVSKDTIRGQDYDLYMRIYAKGHRGYNLQEKLLYYHQGRNYYNKITWRHRVGECRLKYQNFRQLGIAKINYIYLLKPLLAIIIPRKILYWRQHQRRRR